MKEQKQNLLGLSSPQPWRQASWVQARLPGDLVELTSRRKPQQAEQGAAANSELFALPWLPGAQAPFLLNILAGRTKNNSVCPLRGIEAQSQELCWWG